MWEMHEYRNQTALLEALTEKLGQCIRHGVSEHGKASIALSGGRTPKALYQQLSRQSLPWQAVTVSLVDERWVDEMHPQSNARLVKNSLIQNDARRAHFIGMKTSHTDAFAAADSLSGIIARQTLPLDLVLLGMGVDGHTASFFPHAKGLEMALSDQCRQACCAIQPQPDAQQPAPLARMTLSLNTILAAHRRILFISGKAKRQVLEQAMVPGAFADMPVRAVLHNKASLTEVYYAPDD
jgi:6-phosphogluconolactonase